MSIIPYITSVHLMPPHRGSFGFQRESDGQMFEVQIPPFNLESSDLAAFVSANPDATLPNGRTAVSAKPKPSSVLASDTETSSALSSKSGSAPATASPSKPVAPTKPEKPSSGAGAGANPKAGNGGGARAKKASGPEQSQPAVKKSDPPAPNMPSSSEPKPKAEAAAPAKDTTTPPATATAKGDSASELEAELESGNDLSRWPPALKHNYSETNADSDWCLEPAVEPADTLPEMQQPNGEGATATDENGKKQGKRGAAPSPSGASKRGTKASESSEATEEKRRPPRGKSTRSDRDPTPAASDSSLHIEVEQHSDTNANGGPKPSS